MMLRRRCSFSSLLSVQTLMNERWSCAMWQIKAFPKRHAQNDVQTLITITSRWPFLVGCIQGFRESRHLNDIVCRGVWSPPLKSIPPLIGIPPLYFWPPSPSFTGLFPRHTATHRNPPYSISAGLLYWCVCVLTTYNDNKILIYNEITAKSSTIRHCTNIFSKSKRIYP